jgi:Rrf2 family protein
VRRIADAHGIPQNFLVQILLQLKKNGLVKSTRGASGGYRLTRPPHQISVWEVAAAMEGYDSEVTTQTGGPAADVLRETWNRAADRSRDVLEKTSLARLAERVRKESHDMYYI